jgi:serine/threonine-protein kinase
MTDVLLGRQMNGRYTILSLVAEGGMGRVYRARDDVEGDEVAVKRVPFSEVAVSAKPLFESDLLRVLRHPNLPRVRDSFRDGSAHYLVMNYIAGPTLHEVIKVYERLEPRLAVAYALDVLQVLDYLHCQPRPIIHRDIKATNLKFHEDGRLMVVDFGIAKVLAPDEYTRMSAKGLTPGYGPPEQYTGGTDARTDLFAVGGVLYYLLTGAPPPDAMERVARGLHQLDPRQLRPEVPAGLAQIVAKATALPMDERYESARAMREALKRVLVSLPTLHHPAPPPVVLAGRNPELDEHGSPSVVAGLSWEQWRIFGPIVAAVVLLALLAGGRWGIWRTAGVVERVEADLGQVEFAGAVVPTALLTDTQPPTSTTQSGKPTEPELAIAPSVQATDTQPPTVTTEPGQPPSTPPPTFTPPPDLVIDPNLSTDSASPTVPLNVNPDLVTDGRTPTAPTTSTNTPLPTERPRATETPRRTATLAPTNTPPRPTTQPTSTRQPTNPPAPTNPPPPTNTPVPVATNTPSGPRTSVAPVPIAPAQNITLASQVVSFGWNWSDQLAPGERFQLWLRKEGGEFFRGQSTTAFGVTEDLGGYTGQFEGTWHWYLWVVDSEGRAVSWSQISTFAVGLPRPTPEPPTPEPPTPLPPPP